MRLALEPHRDSPCPALTGISVEVAWLAPRRLHLTYVVSGGIEALRLPPLASSVRTDELWRHTCLEAFVGEDPARGYREFNFSPSAEWAAYQFTGYRQGMAPDIQAPDPGLVVEVTDERLTLTATLALDPTTPWRLGLSAVIEAADGSLSYWALTHPPGRPDFHHAAGFSHTITAIERP